MTATFGVNAQCHAGFDSLARPGPRTRFDLVITHPNNAITNTAERAPMTPATIAGVLDLDCEMLVKFMVPTVDERVTVVLPVVEELG